MFVSLRAKGQAHRSQSKLECRACLCAYVSDMYRAHVAFVSATQHANGAAFACRLRSCVLEWTECKGPCVLPHDHISQTSLSCIASLLLTYTNSHSSEIRSPPARAPWYSAGQTKPCHSGKPAPRTCAHLQMVTVD